MTLAIQTNVAGCLYVWLLDGKGAIRQHHQKKVQWHGSEKTLKLIDDVLRPGLNSVSQIVVVRGPGPFTAVRTGLIIANTLSQLLGIPTRGVVSAEKLSAGQLKKLAVDRQGKKKTLVKPWYGQEPNITKPKT